MPLKKIIVGFAFVLAVAPFSCALGQAIDAETEQQPILFQVTPQNPGPNTSITLTVKSYSTDLDAASISWYVNSKREASGTGLRSFTTSTGAIGNAVTIRVLITTREGDTIDQSKTFRPGAVDLVWESASYTPPFYKGKALAGIESQVRVVAMPRFSSGASGKNYIFSWQKNGQNMPDQSGYGKNSFLFTTSSLGNPTTISVSVRSADGNQSAQNSIVIRPNKIKLIVYPYKPAYGTLYNSSVPSAVSLDSNEMSFSAVPYFAPLSSQAIQYAWSMNNNILPNENDSILTLRNDSGTKGKSDISVSVAASRLNQSKRWGFSVSY